MGIYILIGILYILLFGAFYIGFKEFNSFKEDYYKDKNFSFTKFQNLEDFYNKTESQTQNISNLVESYKKNISKVVTEYEKLKFSYEEYIESNQEQLESIKKSYKEDKVIENYHRMLDLMDKFEKKQDSLNLYLTQSAYKLEKYPEKKHLELKRIINTNSSKLEGFKDQINNLFKELNDLKHFTFSEVTNVKKHVFSNSQNKNKYL